MKNYKIAVAGTGYVGLSLGVLFAQHHQVVAVDIVQAKVDMINNKKSPIQDAHYSEFHFDPLAGKEMDRVFANSKCVLDSAQAGQIGLTIRVLEALGAKKKLITTNEDVVNYDFYREENIYVYDGHFDLKAPFFNSDYVEVENSVYEKYSLRNWLKEIIGE